MTQSTNDHLQLNPLIVSSKSDGQLPRCSMLLGHASGGPRQPVSVCVHTCLDALLPNATSAATVHRQPWCLSSLVCLVCKVKKIL